MKWVLLLTAIALMLTVFFPKQNKNENPYESESSAANAVSSSYFQKSSKDKCEYINNPYDEGSGHYAGFKWEAENGYDCGGNSDSFIEGCEEYVRQLSSYNYCISHSN